MLTAKPTTVSEKHSDQHYFTLIYLEEEWRRELGIQLDHRSQLFQTFEGSLSNDIELHYQGRKTLWKAESRSNPVSRIRGKCDKQAYGYEPHYYAHSRLLQDVGEPTYRFLAKRLESERPM